MTFSHRNHQNRGMAVSKRGKKQKTKTKLNLYETLLLFYHNIGAILNQGQHYMFWTD